MITTRIDAVNACLRAKGEAPVNEIPEAGVSEASLAAGEVETMNREIQGKGLRCNTEDEYTLAINAQSEIALPTNTLFVDPVDPYADYIQRGTRLYDREKHTYKFDASVDVNIILYLDFEELPEHVKNYITIKAARKYQRDYLGSVNLNAMTMEDEQLALVNFHRGEGLTDDRSMLQGSLTREIQRGRRRR